MNPIIVVGGLALAAVLATTMAKTAEAEAETETQLPDQDWEWEPQLPDQDWEWEPPWVGDPVETLPTTPTLPPTTLPPTTAQVVQRAILKMGTVETRVNDEGVETWLQIRVRVSNQGYAPGEVRMRLIHEGSSILDGDWTVVPAVLGGEPSFRAFEHGAIPGPGYVDLVLDYHVPDGTQMDLQVFVEDRETADSFDPVGRAHHHIRVSAEARTPKPKPEPVLVAGATKAILTMGAIQATVT
jgi:hypothetical protein